MKNQIKPETVNICHDCGGLVTVNPKCPLCMEATEPHEDRGMVESYCTMCGEGPLPVADIHVVTWEEDPYRQCDDGTLITICAECKKSEEEDCDGESEN